MPTEHDAVVRTRSVLSRRLVVTGLLGIALLLFGSEPGRAAPAAPDFSAPAGGPDAFGYRYVDNLPGNPPLVSSYVDISGRTLLANQGTKIPAPGDDDSFVAAPAFPFTYYGTSYGNLRIFSNGMITFGAEPPFSVAFPTNTKCSSGKIDPALVPLRALMPLFDDLTPNLVDPSDPFAGIYYKTIGTAPNRIFMVQYERIPFFAQPSAQPASFQVQLYEQGQRIRFEYRDVQGSPEAQGASAMIGISGRGASDGLDYGACNTARLVNGRIVQFGPPSADTAIAMQCDALTPLGRPRAGLPWTCQIDVTSTGPDQASDTTVTLTLPDRVRYLGDSDSCSVSPGTGPLGADQLICVLGTLPAGGGASSFELELLVDPDAVADTTGGLRPLTLDASVISNAVELNPDNNQASITALADESADLAVAKLSLSGDQAQAGQTFSYQIVVDNEGPSHARGVRIQDDILADAAFSVVQIVTDPARFDSCSVIGAGAARSIECRLEEPLEPVGAVTGGTGRWTIRVDLTASDSRSVSNLARAVTKPLPALGWDSGTPDPDESNNFASAFVDVSAVADLRITKQAIDRATLMPILVMTAGLEIGWRINVTNVGPSLARDVTVVDLLPAGLVKESVDVYRSGCTVGTPGDPSDPLICQLGNLASGQSLSFDLSGDIDPSFIVDQPNTGRANLIHNDAYVTSTTFDPNLGQNRQNSVTRVLDEADLTVFKEDSPEILNAGEIVTYQIHVVNDGPSTSEDVRLLDELPAGFEFVSASHPGCYGIYGPVRAVFCELGDILPHDVNGDTVVLINVLVTQAVAAGEHVNRVEVYSRETFDPSTPNVATVSTTIRNLADLVVTKTVDEDLAVPGDTLHYHITVRNTGPSLARGVLVNDTLPVGVTYLYDSLGCGSTLMSCALGDIPPKASASFDIVVRVNPNLACDATLVNRVSVTSTTPERTATDNASSARLSARCAADLRIRKFGKTDGVVRAGERLTYTLIVDNLGPSWAEGVALVDEMTSSGNFDILSIAPNVGGAFLGASCAIDAANTLAGPVAGAGTPVAGIRQRATIRCNPGEPMPVFDAASGAGRWIIEMVVTAAQTTDIDNTASVSSPAEDPDPSNDEAYVEHEIIDVADLSVTKTAIGEVFVAGAGGCAVLDQAANAVTAGRSIEYLITVRNGGPSDAENVRVLDRLPAGITVTDVEVLAPALGSCSTGAPGSAIDLLSCGIWTADGTPPTRQVMRLGDSAQIRVRARVDADLREGTLLENDVRVLSDNVDDNEGDNQAFNLSRVSAWADLSVTKQADPAVATAGETLTYRLTAVNGGPSDATEVVLRDQLPSQVRFLAARATGSSDVDAYCTHRPETGEVLCHVERLPAGGSAVIDIQVLVEADAVSALACPLTTRNEAWVSSGVTEICDVDNRVELDVDVNAEASMRIEKIALSRSQTPSGNDIDGTLIGVPGGTQTYRISIVNDGPSQARNVVVTDDLDARLSFLYASSASCSAVGQLVSCPFGDLAPGEGRVFEIVVAIAPDAIPAAGDVVDNTAAVAWEDCSAKTRRDTERVRLRPLADLRIRKFGKMDGQVRAGELLTYTVVVDNLGPSWAPEVTVLDEMVSSGDFDIVSIDADLGGAFLAAVCTIEAASTEGGPVAGLSAPVIGIDQRATVRCQPGEPMPVYAGGSGAGRWVIEMVVTAAQTTDIDNTASVGSGADDADPSNNEAYVEHEIIDVADLSVTKTAVGQVRAASCPPAPPAIDLLANRVTAGLDLVYTITVRNDGPSDAENVVVYDRLPPGIVVKRAQVTQGNGQCSTGEAGNPLDKLVCGVWTSAGTPPNRQVMAPGDVAVIEVQATVDPALAEGTTLENDVAVDSDNLDDNTSNNQAYNLTTVVTAADLTIDKSDNPDPVVAGKTLEYSIAVTNDGPSVARNVVVADLLPAGLSFEMAMSNIGSAASFCKVGQIDTQLVECSLGDLLPGQTLRFTIVTRVAPDAVPSPETMTTLRNTAIVQSDTFDPCGDNIAIEDTMVHRMSQVTITKQDSPDPVIAGAELRYRIDFANLGMSTAVAVAVRDQLPAGLTGLRCEPLDPDERVDCLGLGLPGGIVTLTQIQRMGQPVWSALPGTAENDLDPNEGYGFYLVALVDSGYVLDGRGDTGPGAACSAFKDASGWGHWAHNAATIQALHKVAGVEGLDLKVDNECTRVDAAADLAVEKTDIFGDPQAMPGNYFLQCDPVQPGGMLSYFVTVRNLGLSDAAEVLLEDLLPQQGVALDPAQVTITPVSGAIQVEEVRDTGLVKIVIGADDGQIGRLNADSVVRLRIDLMVTRDAVCGSELSNLARVMTRRDTQDQFPPINGSTLARTPTPDPDLTNNEAIERTRIECPSITVNKTVSFDGLCPGLDLTRINDTGQPVTFCYEITNTGTTYLDTIVVTDTLTTRTQMMVQVFTDTIRFGIDPKLPVAPGETVLRQVTVPHLTKECGIATDTVVVTAVPVNSGRTVYPCLTSPAAQDTAVIEVPCAGVDWRLALPNLGGDDCEAWVQVQNVGDLATKALLVVWGEPGFCPPQAAGPLKVECTGLLRPGSAWSFALAQLPAGARSAIVYSINATDIVSDERGTRVPFADYACLELFDAIAGDYAEWWRFDVAYRSQAAYLGRRSAGGERVELDFGAHQGEPLAVSVNRSCPDAGDPNAMSNAAYTGLSRDMLGVRDPATGAYMYYAPLIFASNAGLNTMLHLQNMGDECTSLEIWLKGQDNCLRPIIGDILTLTPGESLSFDPNTVVGPDWLGSAWIRATQPIAIVVDATGTNHFTSYVGVAADNDPLGYTYGNQVSFAPLIYSEYQGWDTAIQVQNLSPVTNAKVKVYFLDRSGDVITTLVDWICPRGSQTFFLPTIAALGGNWVGSARIESQSWWAPGTNPIDYPKISSVVLLEKWSDPARTTRREAVAYNGQTECLLYDWQVGSGKGGTQSGSAVFAVPLLSKGSRGINSELAITNLVAKPGFTDFAIFIYDQNGLLDFVCQKLHDRQVEYIDLATWGYVPPNFLGSAIVSATFWEHDVFDPEGGFARNLVGLGGVVVERIGVRQGEPDIPGDESKAFEAVPIFDHFAPQGWLGEAPRCPGQPSFGP